MVIKTPLWKFAEQTPSGCQAETKTKAATTQAQPATGTPAKPAAPQVKAPAQAKPQTPAQAQMRPPAPAQPPRPAPVTSLKLGLLSLGGASLVPSESLDEDRLPDFPESEADLIAKQARSELLDRVVSFCELEREDTKEQKQVMGVKHPLYHDPARSTINLGLPWHSIAEEIADLNLKIVNGHINKCMKPCHPAKRLGPKEFLTGVGYLTHNLEG